MTKVQISTITSRTDVTAVCFARGYIFAGIGSRLYITNTSSKCVQVTNALERETIFNIKFSSNANKMLVCGCNAFVICTFNFDNATCKKLTSIIYYPDWILTVEWINDNDDIAAVSMHNKFVIWNCQDFGKVSESVCEERCILYSAHIAGKKWGQLVIMSGTVFNEILIWCPHVQNEELCSVLTSLQSHQGVIFSIDYNPHAGIICSTSDDRSLKVWQTKKADFSMCMINDNSVKLKHTLYGHSSRVFRCRILEEFIITAGEDSLINLWDFNGNSVRKFKTQDGNCLWAIDYNENEIIVGGSDSGVTIFSFNTDFLHSNVHCLSMNNIEKPVKINYMKSDNLIILSEKGSLYYHDVKANKSLLVSNHEDLKKYSLMEVSQCGRLLSLCGYMGNIHVYKEVSHGLEYVLFHEIPDLGRVFSFHWLTCSTFLCCSRNGTLSLWELKNHTSQIVLNSVFKLPKSQQRWSTAANSCGENHFIVGDRKGNVHLFVLGRLYPVQTVKKAHNNLGITHLSYSNINRKVLSLGANGIIKTYYFDGILLPTCSDKLPMSCLEKLSICDDFHLILSFRGDIFTVWDIKSRRTIVEIKCGGRHRSWDFKTSLKHLKFSYLKDSAVFINDFKNSAIFPIEIVGSFHTKEINACQLILFDNNSTNYVLISGGEDTTIKISVGCFKTGSLETFSTLKSHLSSIRCVRCTKRTTFGDITEFNLFTAGGRGQIISWTLRISLQNGKVAYVDYKQLHSFYETGKRKKLDSETRIMDLSVLEKNDVVYLIAACSEGSLLIFLNKKQTSLKFIRRAYLSKPKCITKLVNETILETDVLICTLTSGDVMFVDLSNILNDCESEEFKQTEYFSFKTFKLHQNAINSITLRKIDEKRLLLVTGGDDSAINASLLQVDNDDNKINVQVITSCNDTSEHCAQITGLCLSDNRLFSVSIDQRFIVYDVRIGLNKLDLKTEGRFFISVPDIQGMEFYKSNETCYALCFGRGIEMLKINTESDDD